MILVQMGHVPYEEHHHVDLFTAYAREALVVYVDQRNERFRFSNLGQLCSSNTMTPTGSLPTRGLMRLNLEPSLPFCRLRRISQWSRWLGVRALLRTLRAHGGRDVILIVQSPAMLPTLSGLDVDLSVYQVIDGYVALAPDPNNARLIARAHRRMARTADLVWAISKPLADELRRHRSHVYETTTGVDFRSFAEGATGPVWAVTTRIPRPHIGLVGNLNDRIDWNLINNMTSRRPEWHFVFVGPIYHAGPMTERALADLSREPNFHHIPEVAPEDIPACIASLDVCLIPYRPGPGTWGINPLKLYQYLAVGKPVVGTPLPVLEGFRDVIDCCETVDEFLDRISGALQDPDRGRIEVRQRRAKMFDWAEVARSRMSILSENLNRAVLRRASSPFA